MSLHSLASGADLHDDKRIKQDVRVVATSNIPLSTPGTAIDGVSLASGDRVLLTAQSTNPQNGIYQWNGAASTMSRTSDATRDIDFVPGFLVYVREGTINHNSIWIHTTTGSITVNTTALVFQSISAVGPQGLIGPQGPTGPEGPKGDPGDGTAASDPPYILIQDQKSSGTNGGTFTAGSFVTRDLNTVVIDTQHIATLSSNQITLGAGQYRVSISCPAFQVNTHTARLQNITDGTTLLSGTSEEASTIDSVQNRSFIVGRFTLLSPKTLEVQHRSGATGTSTGFGTPASFGVNEVYTTCEIWFVAASPPVGVQITALPPRPRSVRRAAESINPQSNTLLPV